MSKYGHFINDGTEFLITTPDIPRNWYNYMWNNNYVSFVSQVGFGEGFCQDSLGRRIPLISNRSIFIKDENNCYWTANGLPVDTDFDDYSCIHGLGYTSIKMLYNSLKTEYTLFVPENGNMEFWTLKVTNEDSKSRSIKVIPYVKTEIDGIEKPQTYNTSKGKFHNEINTITVNAFACFGSDVQTEVFGYLMSKEKVTGFDTVKSSFIGTYGTEQTPTSLKKDKLSNNEAYCEKACFAVENTVVLQPGESKTLYFATGVAMSEEELTEINNKYFSDTNKICDEFDKMKASKLNDISGVTINTPDSDLNYLFNWTKHQTNLGSRWARVRHNGYRDITSDSECLASFNPILAKERIKRILSYQYSNGYAPRTFLDGTIRDNNFSDNTVWLTFAVYSLIMELGDLSILDETVPYNDGTNGTIYQHIKASVDFLWGFRGLHGLVKLWGGDWNDCLNQAGLEGKGVSVWLSIAWYRANKMFAELAELVGNKEDVETCIKRGNEMKQLIDQYGWDGEYYRVAYTDDDIAIGSKECDKCQVSVLPQIWAVLSGVSFDNKDRIAMDKCYELLDTDLGMLISSPAYDEYLPFIGTVTQKPPGVHENGGVYLHTMAWKLAADSMLKRNDRVESSLKKMLPHNKEYAEKFCEPYIMCNSYFPHFTGRRQAKAGQSWRTASGQWLTKSIINYIFGIKPTIDGLKLDPCIPPSWAKCSIIKNFRGAVYNITYQQNGVSEPKGIDKIIVNDELCDYDILPYKDGVHYDVKVYLRGLN